MTPSLKSLTEVFSDEKVLRNRLLNRLGIQVLRTVAANLVYHARKFPIDPAVRLQIHELRREGFLVWPNFLPAAEFDALLAEFSRILETGSHSFKALQHGANILRVVAINRLAETPKIRAFFADPRLKALFEAAERRPMESLCNFGKIELLIQGLEQQREDVQADLHSDIWFHNYKAWFFLADVNAGDGPLIYVRRSHRLNTVRLLRIYEHSVGWEPGQDGSRRIPPEESARHGFQETVLTCPRNTLLMVDNSGYHRRCLGEPGRERHALQVSVRTSPFDAHGLRARLRRYPGLHDLLRRARHRFDW